MSRCRQPIMVVFLFLQIFFQDAAWSQTAPTLPEQQAYTGLHAAALTGDVKQLRNLLEKGADIDVRDAYGRSAVHIAAYESHENIIRVLAESGADLNAFEDDAYDAITIAAVANDIGMLRLLIELGGNPENITSPYDGTALIAAAHLGHFESVRVLAEAGAPLDHINNLGWTALIEAVVLGDGGASHVKTVNVLLEAGADIRLTDEQGITPLQHARQRGYARIASRIRELTN